MSATARTQPSPQRPTKSVSTSSTSSTSSTKSNSETPIARVQPSPQRQQSVQSVQSVQPSPRDSQRSQQVRNPFAVDDLPPSPVRVQAKPQSPSKTVSVQTVPTNTSHTTNTLHTNSKYTDDEISSLLADGYIKVPRELWDYLPVASHIRFFKVDDGTPKNTRFRPGGYLKNHMVSTDNRKLFLIENRQGGNTRDTGYISFPMAHKDLAEVWKRYPKDSFIEIHLIYMSLAQKKKQIEDLESRLQLLESQRQ